MSFFDDAGYEDLLAQIEVDLQVSSANLQDPTQLYQPGDFIWSGAASRAGALACDGSAVSRSVYAALFGAIGTTYGVGDGSTTFNLPDLQGRVPMGAGAGPGLTVRSAGQEVGTESHVLTTAEIPAHTHPVTDPGHAHPPQYGGSGYAFNDPSATDYTTSYQPSLSNSALAYGNEATATTGVTVGNNAGGGGSHPNIQPSTVGYWFIKT